MNVKANYNGCCLYCGKESKNPFCNRECYRSYVRDGLSPDPKQAERDRSKQLRDALTDAMVRKAIYRASQGTIKYNQITTEMIIEKRAHILEWRKRQEELKANQEPRKKRDPHCAICGKEISGRLKYCSERDDAPELDHIIPWAQSGEHSYRNTQCTCRKCNEAKGAALQGQLRMFG